MVEPVPSQAFGVHRATGSQPRRWLTDWRYSHSMAASIAFSARLAQEMLFLDRPWGRAPGIRRQHRHTASQIRRDRRRPWNLAGRHRVTRQPRQPRTETYDKKAVLRLARQCHDELAVTTFFGDTNIAALDVECSGSGGPVCCQIAAKNDQDPFVTSPKGSLARAFVVAGTGFEPVTSGL